MMTLSLLATISSIIVGLILIGGFLRSKYSPVKRFTSNSIENIKKAENEGNIEREGKYWTYTVKEYEGSIDEINVREKPSCADCKSPLERTRDNLVGLNKRVTIWECRECGEYYDYDEDEPRKIKETIRKEHS